MSNYIVSSHGPFENLKFQGHESEEEYNKEAGAPNQETFPGYVSAVLADADGALITWNGLPKFGRGFVKTVEEATGLKRRQNEKAFAKAKERSKTPDAVKPEDYLETTASFYEWVFAQLDDAQKASLSAQAIEYAATIKADASPSARGPKGPSKDLLAKADSVLALDEDAREGKITKWSNLLAGESVTFELARDEAGVPNRESLAYMAGEVLKVA